MLAFTRTSIPDIASAVDFLNVMTYDLLNRRDDRTAHHAGLSASRDAVRLYRDRGMPSAKLNLGLAFYVKWFRVEEGCEGLGCKTVLMEDPETGADLGKAGAFSWHDAVPVELAASFKRALKGGVWDGEGVYFVDQEENLFWSWESTRAVREKVEMAKEMGVGVFVWGLGEDAPLFEHFAAASETISGKTEKSEL
jgi:GH18 family chitinase